MGMGYGSNCVDVVDEKSLSKVGKCKALLASLTKAVEETGAGMDDFAQNFECEQDIDKAADSITEEPEEQKNIVRLYNALVKEFEKQTKLGLTLCYHSSDDGDRYDDVQGVYWAVDGYREISKAGKAAEKKGIHIAHVGFVTFG
jgi:hypothetical protein